MAHVATITIDHTKVPGDLTDYVGLIVPDGSAGYAALYALCLEGGGDIRLFKSDDTTELAREIVTFSVTDETGEIHYKYSGTLSSSVDTDIHVYADGSSSEPAASATYGSEAVWPSSYAAVFHMNDASGTLKDSTGNSNNAAVTGTLTYGESGEIGDAVGFRTPSTADYATLTTYPYTGENTLTWQGWVNQTSALGSANESHILHWDSFDTWIDRISGDRCRFGIRNASGVRVILNATTTWTTGVWQMFHATYDGSTMRMHMDGVADSTTASQTGNLEAQTNRGQIGSRTNTTNTPYGGDMDEIRLLTEALSANWITTEYNNQNSPSTFYSVAAVAGGSAAQAARRGVIMMM